MSGQPRTLFRQQVLQDSLVRLRSQQRFRVVVRRHDVLHYCHQAPERTQETIRTPLVRTIPDATLILLQFLNMRPWCFCQGRPRNFGKQNIETPQSAPYQTPRASNEYVPKQLLWMADKVTQSRCRSGAPYDPQWSTRINRKLTRKTLLP